MTSVHATEFTLEEQIIARLAREYTVEGVGVGATVCGDLAARLAKAIYAPQLVLIVGPHSGFDVPVTPKLLNDEWAASHLAIRGSDWRETFDLIGHQRYAVTIGPVQIDETGAMNIAELGQDWAHPKVQMIGSRGLPDHNACTPTGLFAHVRRHTPRTFVKRVDFASSAGLSTEGGNREPVGVPRLVVSDLGVFTLDRNTSRLQIETLHRNVTFEQVQGSTEFDFPRPKQVNTTEPPTNLECEWIRERLDPLGTVRLEREGPTPELYAELLDRERGYWTRKTTSDQDIRQEGDL